MMAGMRFAIAVWLIALAVPSCAQRWWLDEPFRLIQTNLRETDAVLDAERLARQLAEYPANTLLFGMGGIVAYYPTRVEYHYPSPHLPPGRDLFGDMLRAAHARNIRVIGRFDLSKTQKAVYDAHPEWFFRRANGEPVVYNGLYSVCINGGYYRQHAKRILAEALERYDVDGLFFNMFGNPSSDYSGNPTGHCHCDACRTRFRQRYGGELPRQPDARYREFMEMSRREVAAEIAALIRARRPKAGFFTYIQQHTDGIMSESNTAVGRPLPLWPYSASDNVNRARNSEPSKMAVNLCMSFVDFPWRFATVPANEIRLRLYQNMAHGSGPALNMHGAMDQEDRAALDAARSVFQWHARHEDLYVGQVSAARVLLLGGRGHAYRGFFRMLSEQHVPFAVSDNLAWISERPRDYDLVIAPEGVPAALETWVREGGRVLAAGVDPPGFGLPRRVRSWDDVKGYFRIRDHALFPSLKRTNLVFLNGGYAELEPAGKPLLTLIPPSMFGPPEKVHVDMVETDKPGLLLAEAGRGRIAYLPWDIGGLYYRHSPDPHRGLVGDLIDHLLAGGRQLRTNAHPLVEISVMRQPARKRVLVHLINLSGHSQTAYFAPVPMRGVELELAGDFRSARSAAMDKSLALVRTPAGVRFTVPELAAYDVVILE